MKHLIIRFLQTRTPIFGGLLAIILFYTFFTFSNLGTSLLWGDEEYRALMGKITLTKGYPTHWDGNQYAGVLGKFAHSNLFSDPYIEAVGSWFQYYVIALSYFIFGISTWSARFPFWFSGLLVFIAIYRYRHLFPSPNATFALTAVMLLFNVTFLIYARQANYYMTSILFTLLSSLIFLTS